MSRGNYFAKPNTRFVSLTVWKPLVCFFKRQQTHKLRWPPLLYVSLFQAAQAQKKGAYLLQTTFCSGTSLASLQQAASILAVSRTNSEKTNIKSGLLSVLTYSIALSIMINTLSKALMSRRDSLKDGHLLRNENLRVSPSGPPRFKYCRSSRTGDNNLSTEDTSV